MSSARLRLQHRRYRLPFRGPVRTAHGVWTHREGLLLRVEDAAGRAGWGECAPLPGWSNETVDAAETALRELGAWVEEPALARLPAGLACLRGALAAAREPLVLPPEPTALGVAALLPAGKEAPARMQVLAEAGFRVFKWKVGVGDPADEIGLLDEVCGRLPPGGRLRLDANGAWERRVAERWLERCAERPVEFVEQPVAAPPGAGERERARADDLLRGLAGAFPTALALDESLAGDGDVARWLAEGWPGFFVLKPSLHAAPAETLDALARAGARVVFSSALETRVGAAQALRLAWAWRGERHALGFGVWPLFAARALDGPAAAPFLRREDVAALDLEEAWNALA
jgi:O-succinylbenzoate synthase